ncbi:MAG: hypothetical protein RMN51_08290 [Verrucomicrobiota bacterium]|nr:hypothetical protein [Limisphaera sp.]MDW8382087.1 hypothetical protein [Verrucomicrobiota bacterium]
MYDRIGIGPQLFLNAVAYRAAKAPPPPPNLAVVYNTVEDLTAVEGCIQSFRFILTNRSVPNAFLGSGSYQWFVNDQAVSSATGFEFPLMPSVVRSGLTVYCWATVDAMSISSPTGMVTVLPGLETPGLLKWAYYPNCGLTDLRSGNHGRPSQLRAIDSFDTPWNFADDDASRVSG